MVILTFFLAVNAHVCKLDISMNTLIPFCLATTPFGWFFIKLISSIISLGKKKKINNFSTIIQMHFV